MTAVVEVSFPVAASTPVIVTVYVPAVVPPLLPEPGDGLDDFEPPPQPIPPMEARRTRAIARVAQRRRVGTPKKTIAASIVPVRPNLRGVLRPVVAAVLFTVSVAVAALVPETVTEAGTLQVGALVGLTMLVVTAQERLTWPVKPPEGEALMVEVLPVVAPGAMVIPPLLLRLNPASAEVPVTVTLTLVVAVILPVVASTPVTVTT